MNRLSSSLRLCLLVACCVGAPALAQEPPPSSGQPAPVPPPGPAIPPGEGPAARIPGGAPAVPPGGEVVVGDPNPQLPPEVGRSSQLMLNFVEQDLYTLLEFFARSTRRNFIISDKKELEAKKVTVISHHPIPGDLAWQAFLSALEASGYTTYDAGGNWYRVVKVAEAGSSPLAVGIGRAVPYTDNFMTQLITPTNVSVTEVVKVLEGMKSPEGKIVAYAPTNTVIITDSGSNIRKMLKVLDQLDVAAPRSTLEIVQLKYAKAGDIKQIIEALYGTAESTSSAPSSASPASRRTSRTRGRETPTPAVGDDGPVTAGMESKFIAKVIDDERTNAIIVLANPEGHAAVRQLVADLDRDVDPLNRAQIHVVYLENAKASDVATVLSELSQSGSSRTQQPQRGDRRGGAATPPAAGAPRPTAGGAAGAGAAGDEEGTGAIAAFDSGMRIAPDENTNSLVIIANQEDFAVVEQVIHSLDIERRQVYIDAVLLELSSEDTMDFSLAGHFPFKPSQDVSLGIAGAQLGTSSIFGLTQDLLTGVALGVFGPGIPYTDPTTGTELSIPAFGVVLNALKSNSSVNIISNPGVAAMDNEEAKIVVGRKVPFPTTSGLNNLGQPVVSFQREDVAITLQVTPRVNSSNYVTMEVKIEAQEIEEDDQGLSAAATGGPTTSKRELETVALVQDNQTMVVGGLVGTTDTEVETKVPILGDLPVLGALFRGTRESSRKTNLIIFLTPHIIDDPEDMVEIQRVKEAQRMEFIRRFYGKSKDEYLREMNDLLRYSMNFVDEPSVFRGADTVVQDLTLDDAPVSPETREAIETELENAGVAPAGADAQPTDGAP